MFRRISVACIRAVVH